MKRNFWIGIMLAGGLLVGGIAWRGRSSGNDTAALVIGVSGNTAGYLEPCGCQAGQAGGLARRQTLFRQQKIGLLVDTGSVFGGVGTYERLKGAYLLRGMRQMGYAAVNIGETELALPEPTFAALTRQCGVPFVSCNVKATNDAALPLEPFHIETRNGLRVGITGIAEMERSTVAAGWTLKPPQEALAEIVPTLRKRCDILVVLASASGETLTAIAERFPEIDVLFGSTPDGAAGSSQANRATLFTTGIKGKTVGRVTFEKRRGAEGFGVTAAQALHVPASLAPDPEIAALIREFGIELRTRRIEFAAAEGMERIETTAPEIGRYVGQEKCTSCHRNAHQMTEASSHAHAYQTLAVKSEDANPECLRCHTVGFGAKDGFFTLERTPQFANVQCESCHGRGSLHLAAVQSGKTGRAAVQMFPFFTPNRCLRCHDTENSPRFQYAAYWHKIRHSKK